jgi:hypothetical protein
MHVASVAQYMIDVYSSSVIMQLNSASEVLVYINLFIFMGLAHCVADYPLQSDRIATEKCPGCGVVLDWKWWLCAHSGVHGFFVAWITGIPILGLAEMLMHALIDIGKCKKKYNMFADQALHLLCKALWTLLVIPIAKLSPLAG